MAMDVGVAREPDTCICRAFVRRRARVCVRVCVRVCAYLATAVERPRDGGVPKAILGLLIFDGHEGGRGRGCALIVLCLGAWAATAALWWDGRSECGTEKIRGWAGGSGGGDRGQE